MRVYETDPNGASSNLQQCIYICDAKKRQDGSIVPRESICATGIDYEKRYQETDGTPRVMAYAATVCCGEVVAYGIIGDYKTDASAIKSIGRRYGMESLIS